MTRLNNERVYGRTTNSFAGSPASNALQHLIRQADHYSLPADFRSNRVAGHVSYNRAQRLFTWMHQFVRHISDMSPTNATIVSRPIGW